MKRMIPVAMIGLAALTIAARPAPRAFSLAIDVVQWTAPGEGPGSFSVSIAITGATTQTFGIPSIYCGNAPFTFGVGGKVNTPASYYSFGEFPWPDESLAQIATMGYVEGDFSANVDFHEGGPPLYFAVTCHFTSGIMGSQVSATSPPILLAPLRPATTDTLKVAASADSVVDLSFVTPVDTADGGVLGIVPLDPAAIEIRQSTTGPIETDADFAAATPSTGSIGPGFRGKPNRVAVMDLDPGTEYWFAARFGDRAGLWSDPTNGVSAKTTGVKGGGGGGGEGSDSGSQACLGSAAAPVGAGIIALLLGAIVRRRA